MEITPQFIAKKLNAAADLLETKGWTKNAFARNSQGKECAVKSQNAVCFCLYGAMRRVNPSRNFGLEVRMFEAVETVVGDLDPVYWNDTRRSAKPVIAALRGAAKQVLADDI